MGLALSKHSLSEDISESLLLIDSEMFFRMVGFCVHIQWDIALLCVRVVLPTCEVKRDLTIEKEAFITLKDHKPNFQDHPSCRLINPSKPEIGVISKHILDEITLPSSAALR